MKTIGVDVGGTFTDIVYCDLDTGQLAIHKISTTPDDPSRAIIQGIAEICRDNGVAAGDIDYVLHGTTTATNAVLEHKGARAGMLTNEGFRDIIHIARHQRVEHYSIMQELPWQNRPLVKRRHRKVVKGRLVPPRGEELEPLDEAGVLAAARALKAEQVEAVAVCFLFSYLNPAHEERAKAILERELPGVFITTSSSISPQFREFERFTTACLCAFIGPKMRGYIGRLEGTLRDAGLHSDLRVMASNGGVATPAMVSEKPVMTLMSGLAAGVLGGAWVGGLSGRRRLVTFDIGGTSADIGIVVDGRFAETDARSTSIAGFPLLLPMIDIHTIGAGGGSIAYIDHGGAFRVGPRSAGAVPGPAAYGRGGTQPTVTDANLVLGRLDKNDFLGGSMKLDEDAAHRAIDALADALGMSKHDAAEGVLTVINSNMANAIRSRTVQKGIDPREFALVAFGGAGPLHGVEVAAMLGIPEVIVPPYPGITSAMGLLTTDLKYDTIRTQFQVSGRVDLDRLNADIAAMEAHLRKQFAADHLEADSMSFVRDGDLRYVGQGYELKIHIPAGTLGQKQLDDVWSRFHEAHQREYGHYFADNPIEIVNIRVMGIGHMPKIDKLTAPEGTHPGEGAGQDRPMRVPHQRRAAPVRDRFLPPPSSARRRDFRRSRHRAAEGLDDGHSARLHRDQRCGRQSHSQGRRGCPMNDIDRSNRRQQPATRVDPITGAVIQGALENIAIEMGHKLMRMSYSSIIRESEDFGAALTDAEGRQLCECKMSTPLQSGPIPGYVRGIRKRLEARGDVLRPGDVIMHNDPYGGASHGPDVAFCVPVFDGSDLIGFSVTTAHHLDIGAHTPGSCGIVDAVDAYAEGLQFKAIKVVDQGRAQRSGLAHGARQHPHPRPGRRRHERSDRRGADRRAALPRPRAPLRPRHGERRLRRPDGLLRAADARRHPRHSRRHLRCREFD